MLGTAALRRYGGVGGDTPDASRGFIPPFDLSRDRPPYSLTFLVSPLGRVAAQWRNQKRESGGGVFLIGLLEESSPDWRREYSDRRLPASLSVTVELLIRPMVSRRRRRGVPRPLEDDLAECLAFLGVTPGARVGVCDGPEYNPELLC